MFDSSWKNRSWQTPRQSGESADSYRDRLDRLYFDEQLADTKEWWRRIDFTVEFGGTRVLDFGCGHGALSLDCAQRGAHEVIGLDINQKLIKFARWNLQTNYPELAKNVKFIGQDIETVNFGSYFDIILSKDTMEHVDAPAKIVRNFARLLRPGGQLVLGFSPLYYSPFGDHKRLAFPLPWIHAFLPEGVVLYLTNRIKGSNISNISQLGLNRITPKQFRLAIDDEKWRVITIKYNRGDKKFIGFFRILRRIALVEKFFTISIYAVLTRR
jgi:SAM-dependent methyltransferase